MERYASGEVPEVGDVVECISECKWGLVTHLKVGDNATVTGIRNASDVWLNDRNSISWMRQRFKLLRRKTDVSAIDGSGVFHVAEPKPLEGASLADALKEARAALEAITQIKWGYDGDCGAIAIAEEALAKLDAIGGA